MKLLDETKYKNSNVKDIYLVIQIIDKEWDLKLQFITKSASEGRTRKIRSEHAHRITSIKVSAWLIVCFIFIEYIFYEYFICIQILSKLKVRQKKNLMKNWQLW